MGRWIVNPVGTIERDDTVAALDLAQVRAAVAVGATAVPFHELVLAEPDPRDAVLIEVPRWRGYGLLSALEWLVCDKLAASGRSEVTWRAERTGGATGLRRLLNEREWSFRERKEKSWRIFEGEPPAAGVFPQPPTFETTLGTNRFVMHSGWGVFSEHHIDAGTRLLFEAASHAQPVEVLLDVGIGYGPLAIGLLAAGIARRAIGTDVDSVALALSAMNAEATQRPISLVLTDDPSAIVGAELVVCNFPTHADRSCADTLRAALAAWALKAPVLVVVHASLEARFVRRFAEAGAIAKTIARTEHVVLRLGSL